jgi:DNA polymerase
MLEPARYPTVAAAAEACHTCHESPLYHRQMQAVFGEGPVHARVMLVGEQPGDDEDRRGHPFAGPAGALLDDALVEAGVARTEVFVTNAVRHFKLVACDPWLRNEVRLIAPRVVVALGATASSALFGKRVSVMRDRGRVLSLQLDGVTVEAVEAVVTIHPSAALRAPTSERRHELRDMLVSDLAIAARRARLDG